MQDITGKIIESSVDKIIEVGTKTKTETTTIPFTIKEIENPLLPKGEKKVIVTGENGEATSVTTYKLNTRTGEIEEVINKTKKDFVEEVVEIGTGESTTIPFETEYVADPELKAGVTVIIITGENGEVDVTGKVIKESIKQVIKVGTKSNATKTEIPFEIEYVENPSLPENTQNVIQSGKTGEKVITVTYELNKETGKLTESVNEEIISSTKQIVEIGTGKDTLVPFITIYEEDPTSPLGKETVVTEGSTGTKDVNGNITKEPVTRVVKVGTQSTTKETPFDRTEIKDPTKPTSYKVITTTGKTGKEITHYTVDKVTGKVIINHYQQM